MKQICLLAALLPVTGLAFDYQSPLENFFQLYDAGRKDKAVETVFLSNRNRNNTDIFEEVEATLEILDDVSGPLGQYHGYEQLGRHQIGDRLRHFTYVLYHEKSPIRLEFEYYKPNKKWLLTDLQIDTNLGAELKELARKDISGHLVKGDLEKTIKND